MPIISDLDLCINNDLNDSFELIPKSQCWRNHPNVNRFRKSDKKYIFIHIPKSASSSVDASLSSFICHPEPKFHHMGISSVRSLFTNLNINDYFKFTFTRNPWDRFVSLYNDMSKRRMDKTGTLALSRNLRLQNTLYHQCKTFKEFCLRFEEDSFWRSEPHHLPQSDLVTINNKITMDFIGKVENIKDDFTNIIDTVKLDDKNLNLEHLNSTQVKINDYRSYYDKETIDCIYRIYKKDVELFNYDF
jgi:hypothetical protein